MPVNRGLSAMEKLGEYKMEILNRCLSDDNLAKLLAYDTPDALFQPSVEDASSLLYSRVYPYRFVPEPVENQATFLTLGIGGFRRYQEGFKVYDEYQAGDICFYMFCHVDLMRTDSGVRQDLMLKEIAKLFDGSRGLGLGDLKLRFVSELWMHNNKFGGYTATFTVTDLK